MNDKKLLRSHLASLAALAVASCSGGSGGENAGTTSFQVSDVTVQNGSVWQVNREIVFSFTEPVDFNTVSANTINIRSEANVPATGVFRQGTNDLGQIDEHVVVFQPTCPTRDDFSDAGLQPGGVTYTLRVAGLNSSANTVRSTRGVPVGFQQTRTFSTPASTQASMIFQDTSQGPPAPIRRNQGSLDSNATYVQLGGDPDDLVDDPDDRVYFELDANQDLVLSEPGFEMPLNLYSDPASRIAVVIAFNQPVNPSATNISESRMRLEYRNNLGEWRVIDTRVTLVENCTETGATVRLEPIGVLPPASEFRAVVRAGFQDLVGDANLEEDNTFARAPTRPVEFSSLSDDRLSDEFNESYDFGGDGPLSFQDTEALFDSPVADWGEGRLSAAFSFDGTGGPNGDFDWIVRTGEIFFFDTTNTPINGGPNGVPTTTLNAVNGVVDVRNLIIEVGGEIRVQGPNPMRINATGDVRILGKLDVSGFAAKDVATLNTGNQVEIGGAGTAGGGKGGNGNDNITGPTPRGGSGQGPFRQVNLGGEGGEMGFSPLSSKDARRPGGGGGGRFAKDWLNVTTVSDVSTIAGPGNNGNPDSTGAVFNVKPSKGGSPGEGPFLDASDDNDFFGVRPLTDGGMLSGLVRGELPRLWAGYGGGGGGNAGNKFPNPMWNFNSDEKGGGGGGGGGGLHVKTLGRIAFGAQGQIVSNGARGGTGENTNFLDHIGGTGGGGSGGHIILESATLVDFTDGGATVGEPLRDIVSACGPKLKSGPLGDVNGCCKTHSNGGPGGGGVIQIHVPNPTAPPSSELTADIVVPSAALELPNVVDGVTSPPAFAMVPTFGKQSTARSRWISIGGADQKPEPGAPEGLVRFLFGGIETSGPNEGKIKAVGSTVEDLAPIVSDANLSTSSTARILSDGITLELSGAALEAFEGPTPSPHPRNVLRATLAGGISNDIYLRTPALLKGFAIRMFVTLTPENFEDFSIASAAYDEGESTIQDDEKLLLTVSTERGPLSAFNNPPNPPGSTSGFQLIPRFFQVVTNGLPNSLPLSAFVKVRFQAVGENGIGAPDEANPLTVPPWTSNIELFNAIPAGRLQFFRYEVEFDLDAMDQGITRDTEPVTLDFLKIPFVF